MYFYLWLKSTVFPHGSANQLSFINDIRKCWRSAVRRPGVMTRDSDAKQKKYITKCFQFQFWFNSGTTWKTIYLISREIGQTRHFFFFWSYFFARLKDFPKFSSDLFGVLHFENHKTKWQILAENDFFRSWLYRYKLKCTSRRSECYLCFRTFLREMISSNGKCLGHFRIKNRKQTTS